MIEKWDNVMKQCVNLTCYKSWMVISTRDPWDWLPNGHFMRDAHIAFIFQTNLPFRIVTPHKEFSILCKGSTRGEKSSKGELGSQAMTFPIDYHLSSGLYFFGLYSLLIYNNCRHLWNTTWYFKMHTYDIMINSEWFIQDFKHLSFPCVENTQNPLPATLKWTMQPGVAAHVSNPRAQGAVAGGLAVNKASL